MSAIEEQFIKAFVQSHRRRRMLKLLADHRKRSKLTARLSHFRDFTPAYMAQIPRSEQSSQSIYALLRSHGAPEKCHVISENDELDCKSMPLEIALDEIVGFGFATIIICIPGKLGYFEDEGLHLRFILKRPN